MFVRRLVISLAFSACLVFIAVREAPAQSLGEGPALAPQVADLKDQLESGLRAHRPSEFTFIATVVGLVESGHLSRSVVTSTFQWAQPKKQPFPYFERAMRLRAARRGIAI